MDGSVPDKIGKYLIKRRIGAGATSTVYLAEDPFFARNVAIKIVYREVLHDPVHGQRYRKLFLNEASLAGKLHHPHIATIYDAAVDSDSPYLVMEYVPGGTLEKYCSTDTLLAYSDVVEIVFKCCRALEYAHRRGVIHRDIKPANIMLGEDTGIKITDFGTALSFLSDQTQVSGILGSPAYMSPEQVRLENLTHQTDIYSLGMVMFKLLTGRLPFNASNQLSLTYEILNVEAPPPSTFRPELPALLDEICLQAIQKAPADRYQTWIEFGKDLSKAFGTLRLAGDALSDSEKFNELRGLAFFEDFDDVVLWEALRISSWRTIPKGKVIIHEGEQGDCFYVLVQGEVDVRVGGKIINTIERGGVFGEILYFSQRLGQRTTTITAMGEISVIEIKSKALQVASPACQVSFQKAFMRVLITRLTEVNAKLAASR